MFMGVDVLIAPNSGAPGKIDLTDGKANRDVKQTANSWGAYSKMSNERGSCHTQYTYHQHLEPLHNDTFTGHYKDKYGREPIDDYRYDRGKSDETCPLRSERQVLDKESSEI
jgi:hypothetical protein